MQIQRLRPGQVHYFFPDFTNASLRCNLDFKSANILFLNNQTMKTSYCSTLLSQHKIVHILKITQQLQGKNAVGWMAYAFPQSII